MAEKRVFERKLSNGLTVLVCPKKDAAKVSIQLWYNVGSKHEKDGEKGIAHFIEHMIFKGTQKLSESDINLVTSKLSGYCNAFTSYDYTGYLFDIPVANWDKVLPIMADCMENCSFKQEHLNSEVKAVIQELKMYKDNYGSSLAEEMVSTIFKSHPYHNPIIGYKQDLWSVSRDRLIDFYKKHYTPGNAALVVVGDVDVETAFNKVEAEFGHIPAGKVPEQEQFFVNEDIAAKTVTLFRDLKQSIGTAVFALPGIKEKNEFVLDALTYVLTNGRGSRLYKRVVNDLQLAVSIQSFVYDLFDKSLLFIQFSPTQEENIPQILNEIQKELDDIAQNGLSDKEVIRAQRLTDIDCQRMLESTQEQAYSIGKSFLAVSDAQYPFSFGSLSVEDLKVQMHNLIKRYCQSVMRHEGKVVSIPQESIGYWKELQAQSDAEDAKILNAKARDAQVEEGVYVHQVSLNEKKSAPSVVPQVAHLDNGLEVVWYDDDTVDTIECSISYKADNMYDPDEQLGLSCFVSRMMLEGTTNLPGQSYAQEAESYGMVISSYAGHMSTTFLHKDLEKGLDLMADALENAQFEQSAFDRVKEKMLIQLKQYWDVPSSFGMQLACSEVFKGHQKSKMLLGTKETLENIDKDACIDFYRSMVSPHNARIILVGNLKGYDVASIVKSKFSSWKGDKVSDLSFPDLQALARKEINYPMNRDQIVLIFAGLSIDRMHEDYDKVLLFDQIFTGGVLRSMSSRLFQLREQSGLFYTIGGSLLFGSGKQPGMILIKTIVSADRIEEAERAIAHEIDHAINTITEDELQEAKNAMINTFDSLFDSNGQKASTLLFLRKFGLPFDYFVNRVKSLQEISLEEVKEAVKKIVSSEHLVRIKIGRV